MSIKAPAFQFYAAEYLADENVQLMTLEEEGCYIRLMAFCWREGSIPADLDKLSRLCKNASTNVVRLVAECFEQSSTDAYRLVHKRLEAEREKQREWREKSSEAGKKSAAAKKEKKLEANQASTNLETMVEPPLQPNGNSSSSSSSSTSIKANTNTSRAKKRDGKEPDVRHTPFKESVNEYWSSKNANVEMPWDGSEAKALSRLLQASPNLDMETFKTCLRNRYKSTVNHSARPREWMERITNYAGGALDEYGNLKVAPAQKFEPGTHDPDALCATAEMIENRYGTFGESTPEQMVQKAKADGAIPPGVNPAEIVSLIAGWHAVRATIGNRKSAEAQR